MEVRHAEDGDAEAIVDVIRRAQDALTARGSRQRLTVPSHDVVSAHIAAHAAYVLVEDAALLGSVFVEAVTPRRLPALAQWGLDDVSPLRYLHTLVIKPARQGHGLGQVLLDGVKADVATHGAAAIVLDCWAGNAALRAFYARNGFHPWGIFPEADYEIAVFIWRSMESVVACGAEWC